MKMTTFAQLCDNLCPATLAQIVAELQDNAPLAEFRWIATASLEANVGDKEADEMIEDAIIAGLHTPIPS